MTRPVVIVARALCMLLVIAACGESGRTSATDAARADSSAAGYDVGQPVGTTTVARVPADTATLKGAIAVASAPVTSDSVKRTPTMVGATTVRPNVTGTMPATGAGAATARADTLKLPAAKAKPTLRAAKVPTPVDSTPAPPAGPVHVNEFLTYDTRTKTVSLQLIAGYNGLNGSLNYNGSTNGSHGIYVPRGWRIHVSVTNHDSDLQHSAIVVREVLPPPIEPAHPAFAGAALPQLQEGLHEDETATLDFVADRSGHYMIACGVPGHAQAGMWLQLAVANIPVPIYR